MDGTSKVESLRMKRSTLHLLSLAAAVCAAPVLAAAPALADFRLCNNTSSRVGIAVGYKDQQGWLTEGWWNVAARSCESILKGPLASRYYYVYAVDYDQGGEWSGNAFMCTRDKEFTIRGFENCLARGYDRTGYFEIDTGEQKAWTVQLSEQAQNGAKPKSDAPADSPPPASDSPASQGATPAPSVAPAPATPPTPPTSVPSSPGAPAPQTIAPGPGPATPSGTPNTPTPAN
jgi:uncharacterized membrane protein